MKRHSGYVYAGGIGGAKFSDGVVGVPLFDVVWCGEEFVVGLDVLSGRYVARCRRLALFWIWHTVLHGYLQSNS